MRLVRIATSMLFLWSTGKIPRIRIDCPLIQVEGVRLGPFDCTVIDNCLVIPEGVVYTLIKAKEDIVEVGVHRVSKKGVSGACVESVL